MKNNKLQGCIKFYLIEDCEDVENLVKQVNYYTSFENRGTWMIPLNLSLEIQKIISRSISKV